MAIGVTKLVRLTSLRLSSVRSSVRPSVRPSVRGLRPVLVRVQNLTALGLGHGLVSEAGLVEGTGLVTEAGLVAEAGLVEGAGLVLGADPKP